MIRREDERRHESEDAGNSHKYFLRPKKACVCHDSELEQLSSDFVDNDLTCEQCGSYFSTERQLKLHMVCHSQQRPFQCPFCKCSFKFKLHLKKHRLRKHSNSGAIQRTHNCLLCPKSYLKANGLTQHLNTVHFIPETLESPIHSEPVEEQHKTTNDLESHDTDTGHSECEELPALQLTHNCLLCSKSYLTAQGLTQHLNKVHFTPEQLETLFQSKDEEEQYKAKINLLESLSHVAGHSESKELKPPKPKKERKKNFICSECGDAFVQCFTLENHKLEHLELTEHLECNVCGAKFDTWRKRKIHMKIHNRVPVDGKEFQCDECNRGFVRKEKLHNHILEEHLKPAIIGF